MAKRKSVFILPKNKQIEGVTGEKKFPRGESTTRFVYLHKEPALELTPTKVDGSKLSDHEFSTSIGKRTYYRVHLTLTQEAREELIAKAEKTKATMLMVLIDGKRMNLFRFEIDENKKGVPSSSMAKHFEPAIGFFAKKSEAEEIIDALK